MEAVPAQNARNLSAYRRHVATDGVQVDGWGEAEAGAGKRHRGRECAGAAVPAPARSHFIRFLFSLPNCQASGEAGASLSK